MTHRGTIILVFAILAALLVSSAAFTVKETELAIKFQIGEIVKSDYVAGLHFMTPFVNNVRKFDKRVITKNYPSEQFLTSEGKILRIDFYVKWRISDVATFYRATAGDEDIAANRLGEIVKDGLKGVIAQRTIQQVVAAQRTEFLGDVMKIAGANTNELGILLVDIRVKKIDLPEEVSDSVFNRMRKDFARQAAQLRAEGEEQSERLKAEADRQRTELLAEAYRDAESVRGEGDGKAAEIYAKTYGSNAEFYSFYRSLEAYRKSIGQENDVLVISPNSEFFKYLNKPGVR
jgi:membrane protease subunit HflC